MKIEENRPTQATVPFRNIARGECFTMPGLPSGFFYMVIERPSGSVSNAVNLHHGTVACFEHTRLVIPLPQGTFLPYGVDNK